MIHNQIKYPFALLLIIIFVSRAGAAILEVSTNGPYTSITAAIEDASDFDTILVREGTYIEAPILIDKPLTIRGTGFPIIQNKDQEEVITIGADQVVLEGLVVQNVKPSYIKDFAGIRLVEAKNCIIRNNKLINTFFGIYLQNSTSCLVEGNIIKGQAEQEMSSGNAIHLWYCDDIELKDNYIFGHRDGIYLEFVEDSYISNNTSIENIRYGMHFMFSNHNTYINNTFQNNGTGVAVMFSEHIVMEQNRFLDNWGTSSHGILLKDIKDSKISNNLFANNTSAIYMDNSIRIIFLHNTVRNNGWGVKILGSCNDNKFSGNDFTGNNFDISTDSKISHNHFEANYWSKYKGYDLNNDGIGDVAYNPVTLSSYIVSNHTASIILLRSLFLDLLDMVEKTTPVFVPTDLIDPKPLMEIPRQTRNMQLTQHDKHKREQ